MLASLMSPIIAGANGMLGASSSLDWAKLGMGALGMGAQLGSDILGGALSYHTNKKLQKQSYKYARRLQQFQFDWQERMANTAHQREVEDLRSAGLNPILSATGGNGAAVPSGSGGTPVSAPGGNAFGGVGSKIDILSTVLQMKKLESDVKMNDALAEKARSDARLADSKAQSEDTFRPNMVNKLRADVDNLDTQTIYSKLKYNMDKYRFDSSWAQIVDGTYNIPFYGYNCKLVNPRIGTLERLVQLSELASRGVLNEQNTKRLVADIGLIQANTALTEARQAEIIHDRIQRYISAGGNVVNGLLNVKSLFKPVKKGKK